MAATRVGVLPTCQWIVATVLYNLHSPFPDYLRIHPRRAKFPVRVRIATSDPFVFRQIFIEDEFSPLEDLNPKTIIDLGANVGLASAWLLSQFPETKVFAVEADAGNFAACGENLSLYTTRARVFHGAAWWRQESLTLSRRTCEADNVVNPSSDGYASVEGWDILSLIRKSGFERVDLLKIDIEGAEAEVFRHDCDEWLPLVGTITIELHDQACRDAFFSAISGYRYDHSVSGELDVIRRIEKRASAAFSS